jgi:heat shock protein HslJ
MKATVGFIFFMLFLAGLAFVNLKGMKDASDYQVTSADQLTDVSWRLTNLGEMNVEPDTRMSIRFETDGKMGGDAGCNRFFGSYELTDGKLVFGLVAATRMACPEPANSLEISFLEALSATSTAARAESRLALKDEQGLTVLRFVANERDEN